MAQLLPMGISLPIWQLHLLEFESVNALKISIKVIDQHVNILLNSSLGLQSISVDWAEMRDSPGWSDCSLAGQLDYRSNEHRDGPQLHFIAR